MAIDPSKVKRFAHGSHVVRVVGCGQLGHAEADGPLRR